MIVNQSDTIEVLVSLKLSKADLETIVSEKVQQMFASKGTTQIKAASSPLVQTIIPQNLMPELNKMAQKEAEKKIGIQKKHIASDEKKRKEAEQKDEQLRNERAKKEKAYDEKRKNAETLSNCIKDKSDSIAYIKAYLDLMDEFPNGDWKLDSEQACITKKYVQKTENGFKLIKGKGFYLTYHKDDYNKPLYWLNIPNVAIGFTYKSPNIPRLLYNAKLTN